MSTTLKPLFRPGLAAQLRETAANLGKGRGIQDLRLDLIDPDPDQPRIGLTDADCEGLAESIRVAGRVFQPIIVRKRGDRYLLADGERRWRAARLAGLTALPAIVAETEDRIEELQLVANQHHKRLTNRELVRAVERLTAAGRDRKQIATLLDTNEQYVKHFRAVPKMAEPVAAWLDRADIRALYELHLAYDGTSEKGRGEIVARLAKLGDGDLTVTEVRRIRDAVSAEAVHSVPPSAKGGDWSQAFSPRSGLEAATTSPKLQRGSAVHTVPRTELEQDRAGEGTPSPITNESSSTRKGISVTRPESKRLNTFPPVPDVWVKGVRKIANLVAEDTHPEVHAIIRSLLGEDGRGTVPRNRRSVRRAKA